MGGINVVSIDGKKYLWIPVVAKQAKVTDSRIHQKIKDNKIPKVKVGIRSYIPEEDAFKIVENFKKRNQRIAQSKKDTLQEKVVKTLKTRIASNKSCRLIAIPLHSRDGGLYLTFIEKDGQALAFTKANEASLKLLKKAITNRDGTWLESYVESYPEQLPDGTPTKLRIIADFMARVVNQYIHIIEYQEGL